MSAYDVTLSVVLYRDYSSPLAMIQSLAKVMSPSLSTHLYAVDNSALSTGDSLCRERDDFIRELKRLGFCEYIDAGLNMGFGKAHNLALFQSNSRYHAFVNPDILFTDDALLALFNFMDAHPEAGMCIPRLIDEQGNLQDAYRLEPTVLDALNRTLLKGFLKRRSERHSMRYEDYSQPFRVPFAQGSFLFGRTKLLRDLGGFDDSFFMYLEDADFCRRVNAVSELLYCPDATVMHRWERGSHKSMTLMRHHLNSYGLYFKKWGLKLK